MESPPLSYGIKRPDHAVGNVPKPREKLKYIAEAMGFHEFAEFTAEVRFHAHQAAVPGRAPVVTHHLTADDNASGQCGHMMELSHGLLSAPCGALSASLQSGSWWWNLQDVGPVDSGLSSTVLASNNEMVILPVNEPTFGTKRRRLGMS